MTDPFTLTLFAVTVGVALAAGWSQLPDVPELDGERWFKVMLATLLRGEVEAAGGDADAWEAKVVRFVPYHPAGRSPELKVADPAQHHIEGLSLPGEIALVEALAELDDRDARWARMYDEDPAGLAARLEDPIKLGLEYDTGTLLGTGGSWEDLADWGAGDSAMFGEALRQRLAARWVLVDGAPSDTPDLLAAVAELLGERAIRVPWREGDPEAVAEEVAAALEAAVPEVADRMVVCAAGEGAYLALRALTSAPVLRDRLEGFAAIGGLLRGHPGDDGPYGEDVVSDWIGHWWAHATLDTELHRRTPYLSLQWLDRAADPPGVPGAPLSGARFPEPRREPRDPETIERVDLGVMPGDPELPLAHAAKALVAVVTCWILTRKR